MTEHLELTGDLGDGLRLRKPLPIRAGADGMAHYVTEDLWLNWGEGDSQEEAIADLCVTLAEYYRLVAAGAETDTNDAWELGHLRQYIEEAP